VTEFSADELADLVRRAKRQIRQRMRAVRSAHPKAVLATKTAKIVEAVRVLPDFERARAVALFWPMADRNEVDLRALDAHARASGKAVFYPFMEPDGDAFRTGLRSSRSADELIDRGQGFAEPDPSEPAADRGSVDLVIVPALAVAVNGHRLGYGRGFYDATLPDFCPPARSLVVAFDFQLLAELPVYESDVACDIIVTDQRSIDVGRLPAP
jgi:5-formyltetrahydrofolate cyclo-ligase